MVPLHPCPRCRRHTRIDERECPFCSAELEPEVAWRHHRLRLALVMVGVALTVAVLGCSGSKQETKYPPQAASAERLDGGHFGTEPGQDQDVQLPERTKIVEAVEPHPDDGRSPTDERSVYRVYSDPVTTIPCLILFRMHSTRMAGNEKAQLDALVDLMTARPHLTMEIHGYADSSEGKAAGWLANARAQVVHDKLVKQGADPGRLRVHGHGASKPAANRSDPKANARVEIKVVGLDG